MNVCQCLNIYYASLSLLNGVRVTDLWTTDLAIKCTLYTVRCTPPHKCFDDSVKFAIYLVSRIFRCCQSLKKISVNIHHAFSPGEPKNWPELYKYCMNIFKRE